MKPVVTASQMAEMDKICKTGYQIPGLLLMENAGRGISQVAADMLGCPRDKNVHIYCGPGNNGGDGYVVARHLTNMGARVKVFILAQREKIKGDALTNLTILEKTNCDIFFIKGIPNIESNQPHLIVDALLGTGVSGPPQGLYAKIVEFINSSSCPVLAVDIPTGVNADTGEVPGMAIKACKTATMALIKSGLLFSPGRAHSGDISIIDISMPAQIIDEQSIKLFRLEAQDIRPLLPKRALDAFKNKCGTVAVVAGSVGFTGAAALTSEAVLRAGAGLCYLCAPLSLNPIYEIKLTEIITWPFEDAGAGYLHSGCLPELEPQIQKQTAIAIGPGMGQHVKTAELVHQLLRDLDKPIVLDADGLNVCSGHIDLIKNYKGSLILTPHPGEFSRLIGLSTQDINKNRIEVVRKYASEWGVTLILKGAPSIIGLKNGKVFINSTGNAGMATAGAGDVLTGLIAGFIAQGIPIDDAAVAAVYVHGLAGDFARQQLGEMAMIAGDVLHQISQALLSLLKD
jgi:hydroxyethylthiazole kinase-like uncharacterized protein yjeF